MAASLDADFVLLPEDSAKAGVLLATLGRGRPFANECGFHADILRPDITELFPPGWKERLEPVPEFEGVYFLEAADLAVAKLHAGRPKDVHLLAHLIRERMLDSATVRARLDATPLREKDVVKLYAVWKQVLQLAEEGEGKG